MKQIHSMTEEEYYNLQESGMFWEIFPEASGDYVADATQSAVNLIEATVEQEMKDAGYTDEDLRQAKEFGEKFEALRQTETCCGDHEVDFDEDDSCNHSPIPITVTYDATSLRMASEWVYEHNHHIRSKYSSVDLYEKAVMLNIAKFVKCAEECECASSTSMGGLMISACWIGVYTIQLDFTVDPSVCSKRYSHYVEMEVDGLIDFIESFAEE